MKNARSTTIDYRTNNCRFEAQGASRSLGGRRRPTVAVAAFVTTLPILTGFVMWLADPGGTVAFYATGMGQTLFYIGFIWTGIGMLALRKIIFSRSVEPRLSAAW